MSRVPSLAPFRVRDGRLLLESVALSDLVPSLEGRAALVLGHRALSSAIARALRAAGGPATVAVADVGPREVLAQLAVAGCWARASSSHELRLARAAGFAPAQLVAGAPVLEDGLVRDALAAGVSVIEAAGDEARNVARIAAALGHPVPATAGAPPTLSAGTFARVGGLLAPLLAGPPALAVDAAWMPRGRGRLVAAALHADGSAAEGTLRGLSGTEAPAALLGPAARGEWVVVPDRRAAAAWPPDLAHPALAIVLVRGAAWRLLDPRPLPGARPD